MKRFYFDLADYPGGDYARELNDAIQCITRAAGLPNVTISRTVVVVPTNDAMPNVNEILRGLGWQKAAGGYVYSLNGIPFPITLSSVRTLQARPTDAMIYFGLDSKDIFQCEENQPAVLGIALKEYADISLWGQTYEVNNPGNRANDFQALLPSLKPQHAIDNLSNSINLGNTIAFHPSDENLVKTYLRALHHLEPVPVNPDALFAYAKGKKNWPLALAVKMKEWMRKLNDGQRFVGGNKSKAEWRKVYQIW